MKNGCQIRTRVQITHKHNLSGIDAPHLTILSRPRALYEPRSNFTFRKASVIENNHFGLEITRKSWTLNFASKLANNIICVYAWFFLTVGRTMFSLWTALCIFCVFLQLLKKNDTSAALFNGFLMPFMRDRKSVTCHIHSSSSSSGCSKTKGHIHHCTVRLLRSKRNSLSLQLGFYGMLTTNITRLLIFLTL